MKSSRFGIGVSIFRVVVMMRTNETSHSQLDSGWARGVKETQHLATVADAGSNPVGSTLPFRGSEGSVGAKCDDKLPTKVTGLWGIAPSILSLSRGAVLPHMFLKGPDLSGPFVFVPPLLRVGRF